MFVHGRTSRFAKIREIFSLLKFVFLREVFLTKEGASRVTGEEGKRLTRLKIVNKVGMDKCEINYWLRTQQM